MSIFRKIALKRFTRKIISIFGIILLVFGISALFLSLGFGKPLISNIYDHFNNEPLYSINEDNTNAIFYIMGEKGLENGGINFFTETQNRDIETQYIERLFLKNKLLANLWGWDLFFFYGCTPAFQNYQYDKLLIFFDGHGSYNEYGQNFMLKSNKCFYNFSIPVNNLPKKIVCNNLTVVVQSCYSLNWRTDFLHSNLTHSIITNDQSNKTTRWVIDYRLSSLFHIQVLKIYAFNNFFIKYLLTGLSYNRSYIYAQTDCMEYGLVAFD